MQILETVSVRRALVAGIVGTAAVLASHTHHHVVVERPDLDIAPVEVSASGTIATTAADDAAPVPPSTKLGLVFKADGATWVALDTPADDVTKHGRFRIEHDDYVDVAIASVSVLPPSANAWRGELVVDGTCHETPTAFALISRVSGDPIYADDHERGWTVAAIRDHGDTVLAARLDHCKGTYARPVGAPGVRFERVTDLAAEQQARAAMIASTFGDKAVADWNEMHASKPWTADAAINTIVARDPRTGVTWVSAHAHTDGIGCGAPSTNFWGLYRVGRDGTLEQVGSAESDFQSIDALVDFDGDGTPELLGQTMLPMGPIVLSANGDQVARETVPFFGCPC